MATRLVVPKADLAAIEPRPFTTLPLAAGDVRLAVDRFGLSSNNISYALFGDALGYWAFFPIDADHGCIPVWGFAEVAESRCADVEVGERVFGYLPMASEIVVSPDDVTRLAFSDASAHRAASHPWYNRYYRCAADPVWHVDREPLQATLWALFMTGWALAEDLAASASAVVVASASSKTALALAWTLRRRGVRLVGVTSSSNRAFVEQADVYDAVTTYDDLDLSDTPSGSAFVDAAGSPAIKERVHVALGDRLTDSVALGATHQGAGVASGELPGPTPRFFFIPDVAEQRAAATSLETYHGAFAEAWQAFVPWIDELLAIESGSGEQAIIEAYRSTLAGDVGPRRAPVLSW